MGEDFISLRQSRYLIEPEVGPTLSGHPRDNESILSTPQQVGCMIIPINIVHPIQFCIYQVIPGALPETIAFYGASLDFEYKF